MTNGRRILRVAILISSFSAVALAQDSALDELKRANTGSQSTGKTFDGSKNPQPSDAYPKANEKAPETTSGKAVDKSTNTAGGHDVNTSTGTAKPVKKGSESTK